MAFLFVTLTSLCFSQQATKTNNPIVDSEIKTKLWSNVSLCSNSITGDILVIYDIVRSSYPVESHYKTKYFILYRHENGSYSKSKTFRLAGDHFAAGFASAIFNPTEGVYTVVWNGKNDRESYYSYYAQKINKLGEKIGTPAKLFNSYYKDWNAKIWIMQTDTDQSKNASNYFVIGYVQDIPHAIRTAPGLWSTVINSNLESVQPPELIVASKSRSNRFEFVRWFPREIVNLPSDGFAISALEGFRGSNNKPWIFIFDGNGILSTQKLVRMKFRTTHDFSVQGKSESSLIASTVYPPWWDGSVRYRLMDLSSLAFKPIHGDPPFLSSHNHKTKSFKHKNVRLADDPGTATIFATRKYMGGRDKWRTQVVANYLKRGEQIGEPKILIAEFPGVYDMVYSFDAVPVPYSNKACVALIHRDDPKAWWSYKLKVYISEDLTK